MGILLFLFAVGCTPEQTQTPEIGIAITVDPNLEVPEPANPRPEGYPSPETEGAPADGYPGPASNVPTLDPAVLAGEVEVPVPEGNAATIGGILVSKVDENSFTPIAPVSLTLAEFLRGSDGEVAMLAAGDLYKADVRSTGVFIFNGVPPGEYSMVVDLGFTKFPITDDAGEFVRFAVTAGEAKDVGIIEVEVPSDS